MRTVAAWSGDVREEDPSEDVDDDTNFSLACIGIPAAARLLHMQRARRRRHHIKQTDCPPIDV